ncbi:MAG: ArsA family ATPase [Clostridium sp.]
MRIILYTGKGGVGKTSIAAATACKIAESGNKVLIMSTDEAHSLGDSFNIKLGNNPVMIADNLYAMEIDAVEENEKMWGSLKGYLKDLITLKSEASIESEELLVFPGFQELMSLIKMKEYEDKGEYDVLIVDCAPTGETMSLLKFPDLFKVFMEKIFPLKKKSAKFLGPVIEKTTKIPMPKEDTFDDIERLYEKIDDLHKLMLDKEKVSIRIVTTPEKIVVREAKRSFSFLHLFDYNVDAIIINKIFPEESIKGYFEKWEAKQREGIEEVYESFKDLPIFELELMHSELREYECLKVVSEKIYNGINPEDILFNEKIFEITKDGERYIYSLNIPTVYKNDLDLMQNGDELIIAIKNERRSLVLPQKLQSKNLVGAKYENSKLNIFFE